MLVNELFRIKEGLALQRDREFVWEAILLIQRLSELGVSLDAYDKDAEMTKREDPKKGG